MSRNAVFKNLELIEMFCEAQGRGSGPASLQAIIDDALKLGLAGLNALRATADVDGASAGLPTAALRNERHVLGIWQYENELEFLSLQGSVVRTVVGEIMDRQILSKRVRNEGVQLLRYVDLIPHGDEADQIKGHVRSLPNAYDQAAAPTVPERQHVSD